MNIIKQLSFAVLIIVCFLNQVLAESASDIYQRNLSDKDTGVYEQGDWVFFVVKQQCLRNKKYAGTEESKAAEKNFYRLLAKEVVNRSISFSADIKDIDQPLRNDIKQDVSKSFSAKSALKHKLLFDRNTKADSCVQEYVKVLDSDQFKPNGVTIPRAQVENSAVNLILSALKREDFSLTQQYLDSLGQSELAKIYQLVNEKQTLAVNLTARDRVEPCSANYCAQTQSLKPFSAYDINKVVAIAIQYKGLAKVSNLNSSAELAELLYKKAQINFSQGKNAQEIIQDLTLALNLEPQQAKSWKMLADIARALEEEELVQAATTQYILYQPKSLEAWVYFYLSKKEVEPVVAVNLKHWLKIVDQKESFSSWAKKQISGE
ncbi:hypothetical protein [Vibrio rotiferianus]|uniref:hypothetical protein n=1 Tax=Vibrio rotiferianus TaxID=190895 RepID=UPI00148DB751|nr:hypothetical protein [Vibrio rotiferianus]NOH68281.1 hypothetical protein [Vibrio rotiferianus]